MPLRRNILIFHLGALGDFIITWPLALTLARLYPQSRIFYVTHGQKGALAEKVLRLESLDIEAGWHHLFSDATSLPEAAAKSLARAHTVISFIAGAESAWADNVRRLSPDVNLVTLNTTADADFPGHVSDFLMDQLRAWPAAQTAGRLILRSITDRGISFPRKPEGYLLIHPGSGSAKKNWPAERFLQVAQKLKADGRPVRVLLGEVELERWPPELIKRFESVVEVHRPGTLLDLLIQISGASVFLGNDSGPAHLAGIIGIPALALFGPGDPNRWKPLGPRVRVINGTLEEIQSATILEQIKQIPIPDRGIPERSAEPD